MPSASCLSKRGEKGDLSSCIARLIQFHKPSERNLLYPFVNYLDLIT